MPHQSLAVPVAGDLISEILIRSMGRADPVTLIENVISDFLDRTRGDPDIWSPEHAEAVAEEQADTGLQKYGSPKKGYQWQNLFLPNGTQLRIQYKGRDHLGEVRHQQLYYDDAPCSPSQFASRVANDTSRNAWRDIWVKRPDDRNWLFADKLRRSH